MEDDTTTQDTKDFDEDDMKLLLNEFQDIEDPFSIFSEVEKTVKVGTKRNYEQVKPDLSKEKRDGLMAGFKIKVPLAIVKKTEQYK